MSEKSIFQYVPIEVFIDQFSSLDLVAISCLSKEIYKEIKRWDIKKKWNWKGFENFDLFSNEYKEFIKCIIPKSAQTRRKMLHHAAKANSVDGMKFTSQFTNGIDHSSRFILLDHIEKFDLDLLNLTIDDETSTDEFNFPHAQEIILYRHSMDRLNHLAIKHKDERFLEFANKITKEDPHKPVFEYKIPKISNRKLVEEYYKQRSDYQYKFIKAFGDIQDFSMWYKVKYDSFLSYIACESPIFIETVFKELKCEQKDFINLFKNSYQNFDLFKWLIENYIKEISSKTICEIFYQVLGTNDEEVFKFLEYIEKHLDHLNIDFKSIINHSGIDFRSIMLGLDCGINGCKFAFQNFSFDEIVSSRIRLDSEDVLVWILKNHKEYFIKYIIPTLGSNTGTDIHYIKNPDLILQIYDLLNSNQKQKVLIFDTHFSLGYYKALVKLKRSLFFEYNDEDVRILDFFYEEIKNNKHQSDIRDFLEDEFSKELQINHFF